MEEVKKKISSLIYEDGRNLLKVRQYLISLKELGITQDEMIKIFQEIRENTPSEEDEDFILEIMDFIVGWCHPDLQIF